jgi:hypothetical protein
MEKQLLLLLLLHLLLHCCCRYLQGRTLWLIG